jgi:hypothetical protein
MPKLYEGCYGVTRDKRVVGPFVYKPEYNWKWFWNEKEDEAYDDRGFYFIPTYSDPRDILSVHPTEAAAIAYRDRKPWWRRIPFWPSGWGWWVVAACVVAVLLLSCKSPTTACNTAWPDGVGGHNADTSHHVEGGCDE